MKVYEGKLRGEGLKIGIIVSRFNEFISERLKDGCIDCLRRHGTDDENIDIYYVPGSFELPYVASKLAKKGYDALICLGVVIRGQTPHFEYIASQVARGIANASIKHELPIIFGVITADMQEQAVERAGGKLGNKGRDAALAALELANLYKQLNDT